MVQWSDSASVGGQQVKQCLKRSQKHLPASLKTPSSGVGAKAERLGFDLFMLVKRKVPGDLQQKNGGDLLPEPSARTEPTIFQPRNKFRVGLRKLPEWRRSSPLPAITPAAASICFIGPWQIGKTNSTPCATTMLRQRCSRSRLIAKSFVIYLLLNPADPFGLKYN